MHYDDEQLLACLDSEQLEPEQLEIVRHLYACRRCQEHLKSLERQLAELPAAAGSALAPHAGWTSEAKARLNVRLHLAEAELAAALSQPPTSQPPTEVARMPRVQRNHSPWIWSAGAVAASVAACFAFLWLQTQDGASETASSQRTVAQQEVARAVRAETVLLKEPVQQSFAVEIAELRPQRRVRNTKLEVWADRPSNRYASRWTDDSGALKHAVWRPGSGETDYLYRPEGTGGLVRRRLPPAKLMPLESLAEYGLDAGRIEKAFLRWLDTSAGQPVSFTSDLAVWSQENGAVFLAEKINSTIRVSARRTIRGMTMHLLVDFESGSYKPRLQSIRFETAERAIEFRLATRSIRNLASEDLNAAVFHPESGLTVAHNPKALPPPALPVPPANPAVPPVADEWLRAFYHLHRAGASLGEAVRIEQSADGVLIRNLSSGQQIAVAAPLDVVLDAFASMREAERSIDSPGEVDPLGPGMIRHAWALNRLARRFPVEKTRQLRPEQLQLLETMVHDHTDALERGITHMEADGILPAAQDGAKPFAKSWRESSELIVHTLRNARDLLKSEPLAKIAPLLAEIQFQVHSLTRNFESESRRVRQLDAANHKRRE